MTEATKPRPRTAQRRNGTLQLCREFVGLAGFVRANTSKPRKRVITGPRGGKKARLQKTVKEQNGAVNQNKHECSSSAGEVIALATWAGMRWVGMHLQRSKPIRMNGSTTCEN
ncbi:hypothetical protein J6590_011683 [Homalodisca vitripennis]|nr:hypothetical protein J6590_011683 [Homalodisca vitripennis]